MDEHIWIEVTTCLLFPNPPSIVSFGKKCTFPDRWTRRAFAWLPREGDDRRLLGAKTQLGKVIHSPGLGSATKIFYRSAICNCRLRDARSLPMPLLEGFPSLRDLTSSFISCWMHVASTEPLVHHMSNVWWTKLFWGFSRNECQKFKKLISRNSIRIKKRTAWN